MNQILCIVTIFLFVTGYTTTASDDSSTSNDDTHCDDTGWVAYRDEKCLKLIKRWATRDEAKAICSEDSSQLVSIKTEDEQKYLNEFVFETSQVNFNIWIGAKRLSENTSKFGWDDGSEMADFINWDQAYPTEDMRRGCVVMQSELTRNAVNIQGKWRDVTCDLVNYVVCQKLPKWSFAKLQQELLDTRKGLKDSNFQLSQELVDTKNRLQEVESNPVPIGFIYVQLSSQPEPQTLWPAVQWKDVTSKYAGLFFRAEGGYAAQFGTVQAENAPRVTQVRYEFYGSDQGGEVWRLTNLTLGAWSSGVGVYSGSWNGRDGTAHKFFQTGGEVRPRNMAMRIWNRVN